MGRRYLSTTSQAEKLLRQSERLYKQAEDLRKEHKYKRAKELEREAETLRGQGLEARAEAKRTDEERKKEIEREQAEQQLREIESSLTEASELPSISEELWNDIKERCDAVEEAHRRNPTSHEINISLARRFRRFPNEWNNLFEAFQGWVRQKFQSDEHFFKFLQDVADKTGYDLVHADTWFGPSDQLREVNINVYSALKLAEEQGVKDANELAGLIKEAGEILEEYDDINSEFIY